MKVLDCFCMFLGALSFHVLRIMGKCTTRHLFSYGRLRLILSICLVSGICYSFNGVCWNKVYFLSKYCARHVNTFFVSFKRVNLWFYVSWCSIVQNCSAQIKKKNKLSLFQMRDNLTRGSGCPDDCLVVLCNLLLSNRFWKHKWMLWLIYSKWNVLAGFQRICSPLKSDKPKGFFYLT